VKRAADAALAEYKRDHPDVDEKAIEVDLPPVAAPPTLGVDYFQVPFVNHAHVQAQAALNLAAYNVLQLAADEGVREDRMLAYERELQIKQTRGLAQVQEITQLNDVIAKARDEWYLARQRTEHARRAERQARVNLAAVRPQANRR
jgi:hypothetical protein